MCRHASHAAVLQLLLLTGYLAAANARFLQDLSGNGWVLYNSDRKISVEQAAVPGYVLSSLRAAGKIADKLTGFNERDLRWVAMDTWTYSLNFTAGPELLSHTEVTLTLSGVDTLARISLNGQALRDVNNFHRDHRINVKPNLKNGENHLIITIKSAIDYVEKRSAQSSLPSLQNPGMIKGYNLLRKPASDFGWDWGPAFAPQGIAGRVQLVGYSSPYLISALVTQQHTSQDVKIKVMARIITSTSLASSVGVLTVSVPELGRDASSSATVTIPASDALQVQTAELTLSKASLQLWWPRQLGQQTLYQLKVSFKLDGETTDTAASSVERRFGFRDVQLVTRTLDGNSDNGETFYFTINGIPLYMKGANLVPLDIVPSDVTPADYEKLLLAAVAGNHNMVRVWGGGRYEDDALYNKADELGLLVWQEFMFACSPYPADAAFLANVRLEVRDQVFRLGSHPSIILWGGNNEVEASFDWYQESRDNREQYKADYVKLFIDTIGKELQVLDPQRAYWDSSPSNGYLDTAKLDKRWGSAGDSKWGDMHVYMYDKDCEDSNIYPEGRFVSEYGWQSYPSFSTYQPVLLDGEVSPWSELSEFRMRTPDGNSKILTQIRRHHNVPDAWTSNSSVSDAELFKKWTYLSQVQQAKCYFTALSTWRGYQSTSCNMGTLYWQLNDIWQGPSWSSLDYRVSRWRLLHYAAKRVFAPLALHVRTNTTHVLLYGMNDLTTSVDVNVRQEVLFWQDELNAPSCSDAFSFSTSLPPMSSVLLDAEPMNAARATDSMLAVKGTAVNSFVKFSLEFQGSKLKDAPDVNGAPKDPACLRSLNVVKSPERVQGCNARVTGYFFPSVFKTIQLSDPEISISQLQQDNPTTVSFLVSSKRPAAWVAFEIDVPGSFNDNAIFLHPCYPRTLSFYGDAPVAADKFKRGLVITSMYDVQDL